jgi:tripartite-type tricarboxylate transporter receptor subunit TctC
MKIWRTLIAGLAALVSAGAQAQELPSGPIRIVAGFAPGGSSDAMARIVGDKIKDTLGRTVVIENTPGASGRLAAEQIKNAPPDGSRILLANTVIMSLAPIVFSDTRYDPVKDFVAIGRTGEYPLALATGEMTRAKTLSELLDWVRANPDKANYGVPAAGSLPHLYALKVAESAKLPMTMVAFRGGAQVAQAITGGHVAMGYSAASDLAEQHRGGLLKLLAVSGLQRHPRLQDVPTFAESGIAGVEENGWNGFFLPKGTPPAIVARYAAAMAEALRDKDVVDKLEKLGFLVTFADGAALEKQIAMEQEKWRPVVKAANLNQ